MPEVEHKSSLLLASKLSRLRFLRQRLETSCTSVFTGVGGEGCSEPLGKQLEMEGKAGFERDARFPSRVSATCRL